MQLSPRLILVACAALAAMATAAIAQPDGRQRGDRNQSGQQNGGNQLPGEGFGPGGPPSNIIATFYSQPGYRGAPITISRATPDMDSVNFSDIARSARVTGDWQVCDEPNFRGRCRTINGFVEDLGEIGLDRAISSARPGTFASPGSDRPSRGQGQYDDDDRGGRGGYGRGDDSRGPGGPPYGPGRPDRQERHDGRTVVFFPNPTINGQPVVAFNRTAADVFCRRQRLGPAVYFDTASRGRGVGFDDRLQMNAPILRDVVCRRM